MNRANSSTITDIVGARGWEGSEKRYINGTVTRIAKPIADQRSGASDVTPPAVIPAITKARNPWWGRLSTGNRK